MPRIAKRIFLIGWDGADWRIITPLLDEGKMPNLEKMINNGVMGNIASLEPMLSPILWTSIATGKHADKHQILGFAEPEGITGNIRPVSSTSRGCKALWNILSDNALKCGVINWFASYPAEKINGFVVTDRFNFYNEGQKMSDGAVYPDGLKEELAEFYVQPSDITPLQVLPFIQKPETIDLRSDRNLHALIGLLAQCATTHNITTYLMANKEWDFLATYYPAIDRFCHSFMEYRPPKMAHVSDEDFEHFKYVVEGCYRFHDMMLGRLLELAGEDTAVIIVSDHGFHHDKLRPAETSKIVGGTPVAYHRQFGILAMQGPGVKKDKRVYGSSLIDMAPTILAMLGVPVPKDMDGEVLTQIFEEKDFKYSTIDTYEERTVSSKCGSLPDEESRAAREILKDLAALGYLNFSGPDEKILEDITTERIVNLARVYTSINRPVEAVKELDNLSQEIRESAFIKLLYGINLIKMNEYGRAEEIFNDAFAKEQDGPQINYQMGLLRYYQGRNEDALKYLDKASAFDRQNSHLYCQTGRVYLAMAMWEEARKAFMNALSIDNEDAQAHEGLGVVYLKLREPEKAVEQLMKSVSLVHYQPMAHCHLGIALAECGQIDWAVKAFTIAIEQSPNNSLPKQLLAELLSKAESRA